MSYLDKALKDTSSEVLLFELLNRNIVGDAPNKIEFNGDWKEANISIDKDHTAKILLPDEDLEILTTVVFNIVRGNQE